MNAMRLTDKMVARRITPEIAGLARRAKCPPILMLKLIRRYGIVFTRYAVDLQSDGLFILNRGRLDWNVKY